VTRYVAFLRGINLGRRTVLSADLQRAFADMGFPDARTLLASGNVAFSAGDDDGLAGRIESGLEQAFGFDVGTVLRSREELGAMVAADPFEGRRETPDLKLYVTMLAEPKAHRLPMPCGLAGDFEVVRVTEREIYHEAYRQATGRFGPGSALIGKGLGKGLGKQLLWTNRNWNTILKAAEMQVGDP
jgi:uncharacterized protein (DUF1697 family)